MGKLALVTGATSGIGHALARYHAQQIGDLIIAAKHEKTKEESEKEFGVKVYAIPADLSKMDGAQKLYDEVHKQRRLEIDYLINNAGAAGNGDDMVERGDGKILNVGSVAGFIPGPKQAVYHGTKAFVNSFSQAVNQELRTKHVSCTVLCPGYVDTPGMLAKMSSPSAPEAVARVGYNAMMSDRLVVFNEYRLAFLFGCIIPLMPRRLALAIMEFLHRK